MKFDIKGFYEPTPANIRKMGDALQYVSQVATGISVVNDRAELGLLVMILGSIGKILSNFFVEDK